MAGISANRLELLQIAAAVAQEKNIDKAIVLGAIEEAIQKAARLRYGSELDIRAKLDPVTGSMDLTRVVTVVADDEIENDAIKTASAKSLTASSSVSNMVILSLIWAAPRALFAVIKHYRVKT